MNDVHAEGSRRREVLLPIVDEQRACRICVRDTESAVVESADRLPDAEPARREDCLEDLRDAKRLDPINIELLRLVVESHESVPRISLERARNSDGRFVGNTLRAHEVNDFLAREGPLRIKHRDVEIL